MLKIADYSKRIDELKAKAREALLSSGVEIRYHDNKSDPIRLVFVGPYSAGKSTILKMLTGRTDIAIGADITTQQAHTYNWNGIEVVDTPGIHTELRPDHDEISYEAIASADMLVFVITNELFDSFIADHFRKLAIDNDKAGEMVLVVNKMDSAPLGNTEEQQSIIREDLRKVLEPYTPEQLNLSFIDAKSYLESIEDPKYADELAARSGYTQFVDTLNRFIEEKQIPAKLTTELYNINNQLGKAIKKLQPESSDKDIDALEESFMQQRDLLTEARGRLREEVKEIYTVAATRIRKIGNDAANLLVPGCEQDEVEDKLSTSVRDAKDITEKCQSDAREVIEKRLNEVDQELEDRENEEFSIELKERLISKLDGGLPDSITKMLTNVGAEFQNAGQAVLNNAYKAGAQGGFKLSNFSGSTVHEKILKGGHAMGYKFKPWEATKLTKGFAIGGKVLSFFGVGLSVFMQIKADQDEEKVRNAISDNRRNIRSQFNEAANGLEDYRRQYIKEYVESPLETAIAEIDRNIQIIRETRTNRSDMCRQLENIQHECSLLIRDIHSEKEIEVA